MRTCAAPQPLKVSARTVSARTEKAHSVLFREKSDTAPVRDFLKTTNTAPVRVFSSPPAMPGESDAWARDSAQAYAELAQHGASLPHVSVQSMHSMLATDRIYPQHPSVLDEFSRGPLTRAVPNPVPPSAVPEHGTFRSLYLEGATSARDVRQPWQPRVPSSAHAFVRKTMASWPLKPEVFEKYLLGRYADAFFCMRQNPPRQAPHPRTRTNPAVFCQKRDSSVNRTLSADGRSRDR